LDEKQNYLKKEYFYNTAAVYKHILENKRSKFADSSLAAIYAKFGMLQLLNRDFKGAIALAEKGIKLEKKPPTKNFSISALGHLFGDQFNEAERMYMEWRKKYGTYPHFFLEDLYLLINSGLNNSSIKDIEAILIKGSISSGK